MDEKLRIKVVEFIAKVYYAEPFLDGGEETELAYEALKLLDELEEIKPTMLTADMTVDLEGKSSDSLMAQMLNVNNMYSAGWSNDIKVSTEFTGEGLEFTATTVSKADMIAFVQATPLRVYHITVSASYEVFQYILTALEGTGIDVSFNGGTVQA